MLLGRAFAYNDAQRNRIGTNFHQLPVNLPKVPVNTYMFDGQLAYHHSGNAPVHATNSGGRPWADETGPVAWTEIGRAHVCTPVTNAHLVCRRLPEKTNKTP